MPGEFKSMAQIPKHFSRVVVLSPHMDDAILSCGGLLQALSQQMECLTLTICTADPDHVDRLQPPHGIALPSFRRVEEINAMKALGCKLVQLGLLDAIYRRHPETHQLLYPTLGSIWAMPFEVEVDHRVAIQDGIQKLVLTDDGQRTLFLSPLGVGHHVDHILCTQALLSLPVSLEDILLYEDFPYVVDQGAHVGIADSTEKALERLKLIGTERLEKECDVKSKIELISHYETQIDLIFGHENNIRHMLMKNARGERTLERFWRIKKI